MAALSDPPAAYAVELRRLSAADLAPVLEEALGSWRDQLDWDFHAAADLVRRFVSMQALSGFALLDGGEAVGYSYYVCDEHKGLIGDLYVREHCRTIERENLLLAAVLDALWRTPGVRRIETQLMMLRSPLDRPLPHRARLRLFPRLFLEADLGGVNGLPPRVLADVSFEMWSERRRDDAALVISSAYRGHIDSHINDQYRSPAGARRFLTNIVQYPGCGSFFGPASVVARDARDGSACGISLASLVAADVGHITQLCVVGGHRGSGLGYELLRRSLAALAAHGCRKVSLTVTASNTQAIRLYERTGFVNRRNFAAYVWE